tara:strand:- start:1204 stop:1335 length:132 start_codon:yes stop_codon:yes gene_type:complete
MAQRGRAGNALQRLKLDVANHLAASAVSSDSPFDPIARRFNDE